MVFTRIVFLALLVNLCSMQTTYAEETDQFTLPPDELLDIGPIASQRLYEVIKSVVSQTNSEMQMLLPKASHSRFSAYKLAKRRQGAYIADLVYEKTGPGYPRWLRGIKINDESKPLLFNEYRPWKTVYWLAFTQSPLAYLRLAPTINMYGYYFGTDKLGHFFMMGHTYYKMYTYFRNQGKTAKEAHEILVTYGKFLELTYLGVLVNSVYSNGDLAANYSGWKFYTNLTHSIKIGKKTLPPILILHGDKWEFNETNNKENLLKPYISDILNEAFNPCRYTFSHNQIRRQINKRCGEWIERKGLTQQMVVAKLKESRLWHGEEYGHWLPENKAVTLNVCFGGK